MEYEPCLQQEKRPSIKKLPGPDGVEAWCIALAACVINFIMAGLARMSGILFVAFIDLFQTDRRQASLPFSIRSSVRNLLGPVVGILGQKYGVRKVTLFGGIVGTLSAASCFYVKNILWVTILWGAINGIGTALITTLPQVVIGQHFRKYRTTASGMAFSGGCVGSLLFPALLEFLLHTYGLGGTFLIISGIIMHTIPAAMILRKPTWLNKSRNSIKIATISNVSENKENPVDVDSRTKCVPQHFFDYSKAHQLQNGQLNGDICMSRTHFPEVLPIKCTADVDFLRKNGDIVVEIIRYCFSTKNNFSETNVGSSIIYSKDNIPEDIEELFSKVACYQCSRRVPNTEISNYVGGKPDFLKTASNLDDSGIINGKDDLVLNHSKLNEPSIKEEHSDLLLELKNAVEKDSKEIISLFPEEKQDIASAVLPELCKVFLILKEIEERTEVSNSTFATEDEFTSTRNAAIDDDNSNTFFVHIKTAFRLQLKPLFLLICICRTVHFLIFMPMVMIIVDYSMDKGLLEEDGKYVIAALSLGDLAGRLCLGWITDRGYISLPRYMLLVMILQGASTACLSLMNSRATLMTSIAIFGLLQGSVFVRHPVLVSKYLGRKEQSIAMGCINFFSGVLAFAMPSYIGYFRDTIGSYNGIFYINGGIGSFVGLLWAFEPYLLKHTVVEENEDDPSAV